MSTCKQTRSCECLVCLPEQIRRLEDSLRRMEECDDDEVDDDEYAAIDREHERLKKILKDRKP